MATQLPADAQQPIISPSVALADNFQLDEIIFNLQARFQDTSLVRTFTISNEATRDFADFAQIAESNTTPAFYSTLMISPLYKRVSVEKVINTTFTELTNG